MNNCVSFGSGFLGSHRLLWLWCLLGFANAFKHVTEVQCLTN
jgi:hypothetical protein